MNTPILLVIFKRPDLTAAALEAISGVDPCRLFVAADGPRHRDEAEACERTRAVIDGYRGSGEVRKNYSERNLGCGIRMHTAISWAFEETEELIVIEDDCIPSGSFFSFCDEMLRRYKDDERVMHVSGDNFVGSELSGPYSYYFSKYTHAWGWATWRRAWQRFDWAMKSWPDGKAAKVLDRWCEDILERRYWEEIFDRMYEGAPDVWDYQWMYACWANGGLSIIPGRNLVTNGGFGDDATHTKDPSEFLCRPADELGELQHPPAVVRNLRADAKTFERNFGGAALRAEAAPWRRLRRAVSPYIGPLRAARRLMRGLASKA